MLLSVPVVYFSGIPNILRQQINRHENPYIPLEITSDNEYTSIAVYVPFAEEPVADDPEREKDNHRYLPVDFAACSGQSDFCMAKSMRLIQNAIPKHAFPSPTTPLRI
jgi:hypothetical protein